MDEHDDVPYIRDLCRTLQRFDIVAFAQVAQVSKGKPDVVLLFTKLKEYWKVKNE